ncbi:hypothetical protein P6B95_07600 [Streptomyces atratus]|nr:hypothetical protein [Streptomyces atratus]WPW27270.1 hypothetical protein P6B95_07600 [Streptomyces atratus]
MPLRPGGCARRPARRHALHLGRLRPHHRSASQHHRLLRQRPRLPADIGRQRQTWQLDANLRFRSWKVETSSGTTWTQTQSKLNHYDSDGDIPRWITEDTATGALTRNVDSASGDLAATTSKTGDIVLQLTTIHGDVALQLPLDTSTAPVALDSDEYGNTRPTPTHPQTTTYPTT